MRHIFNLLLLTLLTACNSGPNTDSSNHDTSPDSASAVREPLESLQKVPFLLVILTPYDESVGRGISPTTVQSLTRLFKRDSSFVVHSFGPKDSISSPLGVFDKKYCGNIIKYIDPDAIIMTKHDLQKETGNMYSCEWSIVVKAYLPKRDTSIIIYDHDSIPYHKVDKEIFGRPVLTNLKVGLERNYR